MKEIRITQKCDFDFIDQWSQVLSRNSTDIMNINEGTGEFRRPGRALVHSGERHGT